MAFEATKEFIEKLFSTPILDFELGEGCNEDDNIAGSLKSIKATPAKGGEKIQAVVKTFPAKGTPNYDYVKESGIFRIEAVVYNELTPKLESFVKSKGGEYKIPLPKILGNFHDDENDFICLEDVRPGGFKMPSVFKGLTFEETSLVLKELAKFHAFTYALIRHEGEQLFDVNGGVLAKLNIRRTGDNAEMRRIFFHALLETSINIAEDSLKIMNQPSLAAKLVERIPPASAGDIFDALVDAVDTSLFPCIIHGDCWTNNVLIKYDSNGSPVEVKLVDFQMTRRGNIFEELEYFLLTSTTPELRKEHLAQLLQNYFEAFNSALESVRVPLPRGFGAERVSEEFERNLTWGLIYMCFAIPLQMGNPGQLYKKQAEEGENGNNNGPVDMGDNVRLLMEGSVVARERLVAIAEEILNRN